MEEISQELARRMAAAVRERVRAYRDWLDRDAPTHILEARAIVAMLPEPVDPDLVEARRCVFDTSYGSATTSRVMAGLCDDEPAVRIALFALKRGRELAQARAGEGSV